MKLNKIINKITGRTKAVKRYQEKINRLKKSDVNITKKYIKELLNNNKIISELKTEINKISVKIRSLRLKNKPVPNNLLIEHKKLKYIFNKEYFKIFT
jgi:ribulose 1,5-bisphosphate carboxylase large subunit-like protein